MSNYVEADFIKLDSELFRNNQSIITVDLKNTPWVNNTMQNSFYNCVNLTTVTNINNNVTNLFQTFCHCNSLVDGAAISLPNNVRDMEATFYNCAHLANIPSIPNSVNNLVETFYFCGNLKNIPNLPNSVTNMYNTFQYCVRLENTNNLSNSVTNLSGAFYGCTSLANAPIIPNSVTDLSSTFFICQNLVNIPTLPNSITNMAEAFTDCGFTNTPTIPNSVIDMNGTFYHCYNLVDASTIPNSVLSMNETFSECINLVNGPNISDSVIAMQGTFYNCFNLRSIPKLSNNAQNVDFIFTRCYELTQLPNIPASVTNFAYACQGCFNAVGDVYIYSSEITDATNCFATGTETTTRSLNVYIPFKYTNDVYTKTYNSFIATGYTETSTYDGVHLKDLNTQYHTLTINPTPSDATVTFNTPGTVSGKSITVFKGTNVSYNVSRTGYVTQNNLTYTVTTDETITPTLTKENYTLTVTTEPADATVTFSTGTVDGHQCTVPYDTTITYTVSKTGYQTSPTYSKTVTQNETVSAPALVLAPVTITINPTPADATVVLTASGYTQLGNSIIVDKDVTVYYSVSKADYTTVEDSVIATADTTINVTLNQILYAWDDGSTTIYTETATPTSSTPIVTNTGATNSSYTINSLSGSTLNTNYITTTTTTYRCWERNISVVANSIGTLARNPSRDGTRSVSSRTYGDYTQRTFGWGSYIALSPYWYSGQINPGQWILDGNTTRGITSWTNEKNYIKESTAAAGNTVYNSSFVVTGTITEAGRKDYGTVEDVSGLVDSGHRYMNYVIISGNEYYRNSSEDVNRSETTSTAKVFTRNSTKDITI